MRVTDGEEEDGEGDRINGGREDPELEQTHVTPKDRKWREKDTRRERAEEILPRQNPNPKEWNITLRKEN